MSGADGLDGRDFKATGISRFLLNGLFVTGSGNRFVCWRFRSVRSIPPNQRVSPDVAGNIYAGWLYGSRRGEVDWVQSLGR